MLTEQDFEQAFGANWAKWQDRLGNERMKELVADVSTGVQSLLVKTANHQTTAGAAKHQTDIIHEGIKTYEAFRHKHGH